MDLSKLGGLASLKMPPDGHGMHHRTAEHSNTGNNYLCSPL